MTKKSDTETQEAQEKLVHANVHEALAYIQQNIKAPKNRENKFGGYKYRAQEDILEAVKPLLGNATLTIQDDIVFIEGRFYIKAKVSLSLNNASIDNYALAREEDTKKGMDASQITGATSSYARKYALNGLFLIDDTQDADATNEHDKTGSLAPLEKSGNKAIDKWHANIIDELTACVDLVKLDVIRANARRDERAKKLSKEQGELITQQYEATRERLMLEKQLDDIPQQYR